MKGQGKEILLAGIGFLVVLFAAYYNHFDNGFYFDDGHTIVDNEYIRDLGNWKMFWTDSRTSSTLKAWTGRRRRCSRRPCSPRNRAG